MYPRLYILGCALGQLYRFTRKSVFREKKKEGGEEKETRQNTGSPTYRQGCANSQPNLVQLGTFLGGTESRAGEACRPRRRHMVRAGPLLPPPSFRLSGVFHLRRAMTQPSRNDPGWRALYQPRQRRNSVTATSTNCPRAQPLYALPAVIVWSSDERVGDRLETPTGALLFHLYTHFSFSFFSSCARVEDDIYNCYRELRPVPNEPPPAYTRYTHRAEVYRWAAIQTIGVSRQFLGVVLSRVLEHLLF